MFFVAVARGRCEAAAARLELGVEDQAVGAEDPIDAEETVLAFVAGDETLDDWTIRRDCVGQSELRQESALDEGLGRLGRDSRDDRGEQGAVDVAVRDAAPRSRPRRSTTDGADCVLERSDAEQSFDQVAHELGVVLRVAGAVREEHARGDDVPAGR